MSLLATTHRRLLDRALQLPEATEDFPWGESAMKVRKKVFLFSHCGEDALSLSFKLTTSLSEAADQPYVTPTGYGLGKHGWVTARFGPGDEPDFALLERWLIESFRNVAPKKVAALLP